MAFEYLKRAIQDGIRFSVGSSSDYCKSVDLEDFSCFEKTNLPQRGSIRGFEFKDYYPQVFSVIRHLYGISDISYLLSLAGESSLNFFGSEGKSGAFFFISQDKRFIGKTLKLSETTLLKSIILSYYNHLRRYPNTLISRYYGMHRIQKKGEATKRHFFIMSNVLYTENTIFEKYDLKGSSQGRRLKKKHIKDGSTFKDLDFIDRRSKIYLPEAKRKMFMDQLKIDTEFLSKLKLLDYSVFLGIHVRREAAKSLSTITRPLSPFISLSESVRRFRGQRAFRQACSELIERKKESDEHFEAEREGRSPIVLGISPSSSSSSSSLLQVQVKPNRDQEGLDSLAGSADTFKGSIFERDFGGMESGPIPGRPDQREIYYLGVIDLLTGWCSRKKLETVFKRIVYDKEGISATDPNSYAQRMIKFIDDIIEVSD
ncbi:Phosphatidylinositol-4-phosphate 5-kinase like protein [Aduncisulcus paluster]|uniref:Phosphatidylinositol-4-phosphate 5-kinase like protein n=1 Tax=Aduncisulcus paluster TaxID=2918883 RepID=A0ABQ5JX21_9EUKA|nr:Phosphatidylinositol-4-phosphate 5-kinase like protein [Aduncisulcus paluster]